MNRVRVIRWTCASVRQDNPAAAEREGRMILGDSEREGRMISLAARSSRWLHCADTTIDADAARLLDGPAARTRRIDADAARS
jgi:hypothetical protein